MYRVYIRATPEAIWAAVTQPEWTGGIRLCPLVEYQLRAGGSFRALANEGMKALGCPDVIRDGEVIDAVGKVGGTDREAEVAAQCDEGAVIGHFCRERIKGAVPAPT